MRRPRLLKYLRTRRREAPGHGQASGAYSAVRQLGGALGVAVVVAVFATTGRYAMAATFTDGFAPALLASAALAAGAVLAGIAVPARRPLAIVTATQQS